ncbi:TetR/AcrR family transcriptional regulator [Amycolatopsis anabasis]|uniref:TetR/AcrR family transcriptional regulator n=1 Tax=Amycolatopsis anabasis TaxID=1840409 RepID=UPI00131AFEFB|nr:TetR/AcrR family transcriptional regulator [Amycolatopsis anabasis]
MAQPAARTGPGPRRAQDIFAATFALLTELGYDGLTVEGVAARSGVNKTTIYRWWPSKDALLGAALIDSRLFELTVPDTGTLRDDLHALLDQMRKLLTGEEAGAVVAAVLSAATHRAELAEVTRSFFLDRLGRELPLFERARRRGEIRAGLDPKTVIDLLAGALWVRVLLRGEAAPAGFVRETVDLVLRGVAA